MHQLNSTSVSLTIVSMRDFLSPDLER
jgi:hypothetical protein